jgi:hypothetical protein
VETTTPYILSRGKELLLHGWEEYNAKSAHQEFPALFCPISPSLAVFKVSEASKIYVHTEVRGQRSHIHT